MFATLPFDFGRSRCVACCMLRARFSARFSRPNNLLISCEYDKAKDRNERCWCGGKRMLGRRLASAAKTAENKKTDIIICFYGIVISIDRTATRILACLSLFVRATVYRIITQIQRLSWIKSCYNEFASARKRRGNFVLGRPALMRAAVEHSSAMFELPLKCSKTASD